MAGLYFEFSTPGAILPGVLGGISLILALYAFQQLPINYAGVLLILLAIVMFIAEIKVVSHGILTLGGIAAMILGSVMLIDSPLPDMRIPLTTIIVTALAMAAFFMFIVGTAARALWSRTTTGPRGAGRRGRASSAADWPREARSSCAENSGTPRPRSPVEPGDSVRVAKIEGLTLRVVPVQRVMAAPGSVTPGRSE